MKRYTEPFIHLVIWCLMIAYIAQYNSEGELKLIFGSMVLIGTPSDGINTVMMVDLFFKCVLFYGNALYLMPKYFKPKYSRIRFVSQLILLFVITIVIDLFTNYLILNQFYDQSIQMMSYLIGYGLILHVLFLIFSTGYRFTKDWFINERIKRHITEENLRTELNFLKSQINPHFLFNTLNNIFAEARKYEDKSVANSIAKLSHLMRYMIHDSTADFVPLKNEIEYLKNYIDLQKLRISDKDPFQLNFKVTGSIDTIEVAPVIFIPFVENAFKYGVDIEKESFINIALEVTDNQLKFKVDNSLAKNSSTVESSGIGLANVKRRLALLYPNNSHHLFIDKRNESFSILLKLDLN